MKVVVGGQCVSCGRVAVSEARMFSRTCFLPALRVSSGVHYPPRVPQGDALSVGGASSRQVPAHLLHRGPVEKPFP
eukprot:11227126-Lingulodinium_polyedra.AAC.1